MIGVYIHWPFCKKKCPYCDFNSHVFNTIDFDVWKRNYEQDLDNYADERAGKKVETVFFGGGTPSLMRPDIIEAILTRLDLSPNCEITIEVNPNSAETQKLSDFKLAGINRISIGVQSFRDENLKFLGRLHDSAEAKRVIENAFQIFDNYSFDLIYGLPTDNLQTWQEDLELALSFGPKHISLYQLMIEENTQFKKLYDLGKLQTLDDEIAADLYEYTFDRLKREGIEQYEVSNYARPGHESRHNLKYWNYEEYVGYGPGAHSRIHGATAIIAREMEKSPIRWLRNRGEICEVLSYEEAQKEAIMMGLRLVSGLKRETIERLKGDWQKLVQIATDNVMKVTQDAIVTPNLLILDSYVKKFVCK